MSKFHSKKGGRKKSGKASMNPTFAEMLAELQSSGTSKERKQERRLEKQYYLVVCEGEKTEPIYFESLKSELPSNVLDLRVKGMGKHTTTLVNKTLKLAEKRASQRSTPNYDKVWVVLDRDSFPVAQINSAFQLAEQNNIELAFSNEAFELWYLLHFHYLDTGISRDDYITKLSEILSKKTGKKYQYQKNSQDFLVLLKEYGDRDTAIRNARKLKALHGKNHPANCIPSTSVYKLVCDLEALKPS